MPSNDQKRNRRWIIRNALDAAWEAPIWFRAELIGAFVGLLILGNLSYSWFGVLGAIIGGFVGLVVGFILTFIIRITTMF